MTGAAIITTDRANWTGLAARPTGWALRRVERGPRTSSYLTWDPARLRCAVFLAKPPEAIEAALEAAGFTELATDQLHSVQVWTQASAPAPELRAAS